MARTQPIATEADGLEEAFRRIRGIDDALRDRLLPPGYTVNVVAGNVVLKRTSDGTTATLVFT